MTEMTTQGSLDLMVAQIVGAKTQAATAMRPLPAERVGQAAQPQTAQPLAAQPPLPPESLDRLRRQVLAIRQALDTIETTIWHLGSVDQIDESLSTFDPEWRCRLHPELGPVHHTVGDGRVTAGCSKCSSWDDAAIHHELSIEELMGDAPVPAPAVQAVAHWVCPEHGVTATERKTSKKGRVYHACSKCSEFERLP